MLRRVRTVAAGAALASGPLLALDSPANASIS
jgi:hypothetical protein